MATLPIFKEIQNWDDEQLKHVHHLLFDKNINPRIDETQEEIDNYMSEVHCEFENRNIQLLN